MHAFKRYLAEPSGDLRKLEGANLMWAITGIIVVTAAIAMFEVPSLWKKKWIKELGVFSILLLFGTGLSIAISLRVNIPNPLEWITFVYKPLSEALFGLLNSWGGE